MSVTDYEAPLPDDTLISVCDRCHTAACWLWEFPCEDAYEAGVERMTVKQLREGKYGDHESYWKKVLRVEKGK